MTEDLEALKDEVRNTLDGVSERLTDLGKRIFDNPELKFEEYRAMEWLTEELEEHGFRVKRGVGGMDTAFLARCPRVGNGPTIAFLSEYDALPGLGHACGHNLIATIGLGAGIGLCSVMDRLNGELVVIGTPAEEGGGGKVELIDAGVFDEVDVALMVHPSDKTLVGRGSLGVRELKLDFYGEAAHASSQPEEGINALDAVIATFNNVNALREHTRESSRVHGIISDGGKKPNIVPDHASAHFYVRAADPADLEELVEKVKNCAEAGALATGAELEIDGEGHTYQPMKPNPVLAELVEENFEALGEEVEDYAGGMGSTDMGDVSQEVPAVHPYIRITEEDTPSHSEAFAKASNSDRGYAGMLNAAKALAMVGVDVLGDESNYNEIVGTFREG
ncbi:MAG: M20 family metallopeptidase [Candidatus Bipolaricaulia bacterium]